MYFLDVLSDLDALDFDTFDTHVTQGAIGFEHLQSCFYMSQKCHSIYMFHRYYCILVILPLIVSAAFVRKVFKFSLHKRRIIAVTISNFLHFTYSKRNSF